MENYKLITVTSKASPPDVKILIEKIKKLISDQGGKTLVDKSIGHLKLAYPIKKQEYATYISFEIEIAKDSIKKVRKYLSDQDSIMRFMIAKSAGPEAEIQAAKKPAVLKKKFEKVEKKPILASKPTLKTKTKPKPPKLVEELESEKERLKKLDEKLDELLKE